METKIMLAFHGDHALKDKYINRVAAHKLADEIVSGQYWENGKGCAVGCSVHSNSHAAYETEMGIPRVLARLEDGIFEALYKINPARAKEWPLQFLSSIRIGADLSMVWPKFAHWLLLDVIQFAKTERSKKSIQEVTRWISGDKPMRTKWNAAYAAAAAAAAAAARCQARILQSEKLLQLLSEA